MKILKIAVFLMLSASAGAAGLSTTPQVILAPSAAEDEFAALQGEPIIVVTPVATALSGSSKAKLGLMPSVLPTPSLPWGSKLWLRSQEQIAEINTREKNGSLTTAQAVLLKAQLSSIRAQYGLRSASDATRFQGVRRWELSHKLDLHADKIRQFSSKP